MHTTVHALLNTGLGEKYYLLCTEILMSSEIILKIGVYSILSYHQKLFYDSSLHVLIYCTVISTIKP